MTRSHPPAWYPDPSHPGRVRRWNGRSWTGEVRPLPDWLRTLRLSPGPGDRVPRTSRRLWVMSATCFAVGAVLLFAVGVTDDAADPIGDRVFARRADERCRRAELEAIGPNRTPLAGSEAEASRNERLAQGWESMVVDLRDLPVAEADAPAVDAWLGAWDRWTSLGRDYAAALAAGDEDAAHAVAVRSQVPKAAINSFALVNGIEGCVFR